MWMLLIACSVGDPGPAAPDSTSAELAGEIQNISDKAGAIANAARDLEQMSDPARERVAQGEDPKVHMRKMRQTMDRIEVLERELQADIEAMESRLSAEDH